MKTLFLLLSGILFTAATYAQDAASVNYLEAFYDSSTGMISYRKFGEITKDGVKLIDLKTKALDNYVTKTSPGNVEMALIQKERSDLESLRERLLAQRERMMAPLPPMQEMQ